MPTKIIYKSYFKYIIPLILIIFVFLTSGSPLNFIFNNEMNVSAWTAITIKSQNLFSNLNQFGDESHIAKTVFRLTIPLLVKFFKISFLQIVLLQFIISYYMFYMLFEIIKNRMNLEVALILITFISSVYFGKALLIDFRWFDGWAFFFFVLALYTKYQLIVFFSILLGLFTDERFIFMLPVLFVFLGNFDYERFSIYSMTSKRNFVVIFSFLSYFFIRLYLSFFYGMRLPTDAIGYEALIANINKRLLGMGVFTFFEGMWLIPIYLFVSLRNQLVKNKFLFFVFLYLFFTCCLVFLVYDVSRSGAYLVPILILIIDIAFRKLPSDSFLILLKSGCIISLFFPNYYVMNGIAMNNFNLNEYLNILFRKISIYLEN
jgi:hypothetical protein